MFLSIFYVIANLNIPKIKEFSCSIWFLTCMHYCHLRLNDDQFYMSLLLLTLVYFHGCKYLSQLWNYDLCLIFVRLRVFLCDFIFTCDKNIIKSLPSCVVYSKNVIPINANRVHTKSWSPHCNSISSVLLIYRSWDCVSIITAKWWKQLNIS